MSKYNVLKVKLISSGVRQMLQSPEVEGYIREACKMVEDRAGDGYSMNVQKGRKRMVGRVYAYTKEAIRDNYANNTLLKALHG